MGHSYALLWFTGILTTRNIYLETCRKMSCWLRYWALHQVSSCNHRQCLHCNQKPDNCKLPLHLVVLDTFQWSYRLPFNTGNLSLARAHIRWIRCKGKSSASEKNCCKKLCVFMLSATASGISFGQVEILFLPDLRSYQFIRIASQVVWLVGCMWAKPHGTVLSVHQWPSICTFLHRAQKHVLLYG